MNPSKPKLRRILHTIHKALHLLHPRRKPSKPHPNTSPNPPLTETQRIALHFILTTTTSLTTIPIVATRSRWRDLTTSVRVRSVSIPTVETSRSIRLNLTSHSATDGVDTARLEFRTHLGLDASSTVCIGNTIGEEMRGGIERFVAFSAVAQDVFSTVLSRVLAQLYPDQEVGARAKSFGTSTAGTGSSFGFRDGSREGAQRHFEALFKRLLVTLIFSTFTEGFARRTAAGLVRQEQRELIWRVWEMAVGQMRGLIAHLAFYAERFGGRWEGGDSRDWDSGVYFWDPRQRRGGDDAFLEMDRLFSHFRSRTKSIQGLITFVVQLRCESVEARILRYINEKEY